MFITTHAAVGAIIAQHTSSPWLAFLFSFLSHFVLDLIPHGDQGFYREKEENINRRLVLITLIDALGLISLLFFVYQFANVNNLSIVLFAVLGSIAPDLITHFFPTLHRQYPEFLILRLLKWLKDKPGLNRFINFQNRAHDSINYLLKYQVSFFLGLIFQFLILIYCLKTLI